MNDTVSSARVHVSGWRAVLDLTHIHIGYELCLGDLAICKAVTSTSHHWTGVVVTVPDRLLVTKN